MRAFSPNNFPLSTTARLHPFISIQQTIMQTQFLIPHSWNLYPKKNNTLRDSEREWMSSNLRQWNTPPASNGIKNWKMPLAMRHWEQRREENKKFSFIEFSQFFIHVSLFLLSSAWTMWMWKWVLLLVKKKYSECSILLPRLSLSLFELNEPNYSQNSAIFPYQGMEGTATKK